MHGKNLLSNPYTIMTSDDWSAVLPVPGGGDRRTGPGQESHPAGSLLQQVAASGPDVGGSPAARLLSSHSQREAWGGGQWGQQQHSRPGHSAQGVLGGEVQLKM